MRHVHAKRNDYGADDEIEGRAEIQGRGRECRPSSFTWPRRSARCSSLTFGVHSAA